MLLQLYETYRSNAASWWFPFFVGLLSGINMFTIVLSAPTALLYVSQPHDPTSKLVLAAVINAAGTLVGVVGVVYMVEINGTDWIESSFPSIFASKSWDWTKNMMQQNGFPGTVVASSMPVILHPIILFGMVAKMNTVTLLTAIFAGR